MGIALGAAGCKALVISLEGQPLAEAYREYGPATGASQDGEPDAERVWAAARECIAEVAARSKGDPIRALSISSPAEAVAFLSPEGRIIGHGGLQSAQRSFICPQAVEQALGAERLFEITGNLPASGGTLARLCWLREYKPALLETAGRFLFWNGLVAYLLGGASTCDYSLASRTLLFDMRQREWSADILRASGLPALKLPELAPAGTALGTVSTPVARALGLPAGARLILGGYDLACGALGLGVISGGQAMCLLGSYLSMVPAFNAIPLTSLLFGQGLDMAHHVVPEVFVSVLYTQSGGAVLRWFAETLVPGEKREAQRRGASIYTELLAEMPPEPTRLVALPFFAPPGPPRLGECFTGGILGLQVTSSRGECIKALLEGMLYFLAEGQERLAKAGIGVQRYRAGGGGARSDAWLQLLADIMDRPVERTAVNDPAPLGAALIAGVGSEAYANFEEAVAATVKVVRRFEPRPRWVALYRDQLERYRRLLPLLQEIAGRCFPAAR